MMQMMMTMMGGGEPTGGKGQGKSNRHRGRAMVQFANAQMAKTAISQLNGKELDGRALKLDSWTGSKTGGGKGDDSCKIYVSNLAWRTRGWKLKEHMGSA